MSNVSFKDLMIAATIRVNDGKNLIGPLAVSMASKFIELKPSDLFEDAHLIVQFGSLQETVKFLMQHIAADASDMSTSIIFEIAEHLVLLREIITNDTLPDATIRDLTNLKEALMLAEPLYVAFNDDGGVKDYISKSLCSASSVILASSKNEALSIPTHDISNPIFIRVIRQLRLIARELPFGRPPFVDEVSCFRSKRKRTGETVLITTDANIEACINVVLHEGETYSIPEFFKDAVKYSVNESKRGHSLTMVEFAYRKKYLPTLNFNRIKELTDVDIHPCFHKS